MAVGFLTDAIDSGKPMPVEAYAVRSTAWLMAGEEEKALNDAETALEIEPRSVVVFMFHSIV